VFVGQFGSFDPTLKHWEPNSDCVVYAHRGPMKQPGGHPPAGAGSKLRHHGIVGYINAVINCVFFLYKIDINKLTRLLEGKNVPNL